MKRIIVSILNVVFPPSDDHLLLTEHTTDTFTHKYQVRQKQDIVVLSRFSDTSIRAAVHLNKFHAHPQATQLLAQLCCLYLQSLGGDTYILIPIPLSQKRQRHRGYNQVTNILQKVPLDTKRFSLQTDILTRVTHTLPQTSLSKKERLRNIEGAFSIKKSRAKALAGTHILIIDDVATTGATLHEAKKLCRAYSPASITCVAIAG